MNLEFRPTALNELHEWIKQDRSKALKIMDLIENIRRTPFTGKGKPEPLKYMGSGIWSRRIDQEHRLVYEVTDKIMILSCSSHYY